MARIRGVTKVQISEAEIVKFLRTPEPQAGLFPVAEAVKAKAGEVAPKGRSLSRFRSYGKGPGRYIFGPFGEPYGHGFARVSYHVRRYRGGYRVYTRDRFAHLIEFGSSMNPVYAPLRRAMRSARGARIVIAPKGATQGTPGFLGAGGGDDR